MKAHVKSCETWRRAVRCPTNQPCKRIAVKKSVHASPGSPVCLRALRRDWVNLTAGPAGLIGERVLEKNIVGYLRFRAVCKSWRRCTASQHANGGLEHRFHPRRWIMLSRTSGSLRRRHDFLNVSTGQRIQVDIPKIRYQHVFGATFEGLLVLCHKRTYAVRRLNSLTR
ncbi:hypothetical protein D1007_15521 [Hordeum vulgare]|nr:hypothetical protein D1007_15521 [Hordeum vulgare]